MRAIPLVPVSRDLHEPVAAAAAACAGALNVYGLWYQLACCCCWSMLAAGVKIRNLYWYY